MEGVERMVCVGNCVGMLRLHIGSLFECFRLLKLPKANLLFCHVENGRYYIRIIFQVE